ncbi:MAG: serine O-acetyltransferase [candidate division NC10 bacterium]|nr:serine O-acetyltransferase [candidate division NC10 bacterium]
MFDTLRRDIRAVFERDPAARSLPEVLCCYPGLHAIWLHRLAHRCWTHRLKFLGRLLSHLGRFLTGIEIHPGARLGPGLFIDHGMGIVIGETSEIGENVTIYQGVTLGGTSLEKVKRHPTIGNNVVIGSGAKVLGPFSVGENSRIGSGSVVVKEVPTNSVVVGVPGRVTHRDGKKVEHGIDLNMTDLPDPVAKAIQSLMDRVGELERTLAELKSLLPPAPEAAPDQPVASEWEAEVPPSDRTRRDPSKLGTAGRRMSQD